MAILTVGSGGDYSTIAAAIAAAGAADTVRLIQDISENVSLNKNIAGIEGDSATARRTWTNSGSTDLLTIDSGLNQAFLFKDLILDSSSVSSGLVYHATSGASVQTTFRNVQWNHTGANGGNYYWNQNGNTAGMLTFDRCEFVGNSTAYGAACASNATTAGAVLIQNCISTGSPGPIRAGRFGCRRRRRTTWWPCTAARSITAILGPPCGVRGRISTAPTWGTLTTWT